MNNVTSIGTEKKFPVNQEIMDRLSSVIHEYDGEVGLCEVIGILELLKLSLIEDAKSA